MQMTNRHKSTIKVDLFLTLHVQCRSVGGGGYGAIFISDYLTVFLLGKEFRSDLAG